MSKCWNTSNFIGVLMMQILMVLLACQAQPQDDFWYGPLGAHAHAVFQLPGVGFVPDAPTGLKENMYEFHTTFSSINVFNNSTKHVPNYLADMEFERLSIDGWYGLSDKLQFGISIPIEGVNGGGLDSFIIGFHKTFGIDQGGRTEYPKGTTQMLMDGHNIGIRPDITLGDVMLIANYKILTDSDYPQWMVGLQVKLPTAANSLLYASHGPGVGLSTNVFYQVADWYINAGVSAALVGDADVIDQKTRSYQEILFLTAERQIFDGISIITQFIAQSGLAKDYGQYSAWSYETDVGFKFQLSHHTMFEFGIFENVIKYANSADFGAFASLIFRY